MGISLAFLLDMCLTLPLPLPLPANQVGISLAFLLDMCLTFNTAYRADERYVVSSRVRT